jgi:hypothetical protein
MKVEKNQNPSIFLASYILELITKIWQFGKINLETWLIWAIFPMEIFPLHRAKFGKILPKNKTLHMSVSFFKIPLKLFHSRSVHPQILQI